MIFAKSCSFSDVEGISPYYESVKFKKGSILSLRKDMTLDGNEITAFVDSGTGDGARNNLSCGNLGMKSPSNGISMNVYGNQNVNSGTTDLLLEQILLNLEDLKQKQNNASAQDKTQYKNQLADNENFKTRDPKVLRFKINGNNLTDSLTTVFFSETEPDGTFLFTADRQYYLNQHARTETIYLLFKTVKSNGSTTTYVVQPTVMQDYKNDSSLLYRISTQQNLTAEKTGNLVTMHCSAADISVELLLDVDSKK